MDRRRLRVRALGRVGRRHALVMADQGMSSLSNVAVTVIVARAVDPAQFGAFSVAMVAYQLAVGAVRAVVGEPWLSAHSTDGPSERVRAMSDLVPASLVLSAACSAVMAGLAVTMGGAAGPALLALAVVFPYLGVQDSLRYVAVVDRPHVALASDTAWLVVAVALVAGAQGGLASEWYVVAWGVAGAAGLIVALLMLRVPLLTGQAGRWMTTHRSMSAAFFGEYVSAHAVGQLVLLAMGAISGLAALGAVRAAMVFYGPLNTLFASIYLALVPDGARRRDQHDALVRMMVTATALITGVAAAWTAVGLVMPDRLGAALFGRTWADAGDLMLIMGVVTVAGSLATGGFAGLRSLGAARLSLRARLWSLPPQLVLPLAGAVVASGVGYTVGFAVANCVTAVIWWVVFLGALGRRLAGRAAPASMPVAGGDAVLAEGAR